MLQLLRIWNALLRRGRRGEWALLAMLVPLAPTALVYMAVLDTACWVRDRLGFGTRPIARGPEIATVALVAATCIPALVLNIVAVVALPAWLLFG